MVDMDKLMIDLFNESAKLNSVPESVTPTRVVESIDSSDDLPDSLDELDNDDELLNEVLSQVRSQLTNTLLYIKKSYKSLTSSNSKDTLQQIYDILKDVRNDIDNVSE